MSSALFLYPEQAAFDRVLPKSKIYEYAKPSRAVRERFVSEIEQIVWKYKLAPETINLPARSGVAEIQIFSVSLRTDEVSEVVLRTIDKAIAFPIVFELSNGNRVRSIAAYKRPSDADHGKWVVDAYFETEWQSADVSRESLPISVDLAQLFEKLLRRHIAFPARTGESLKEQVDRVTLIRSKQGECDTLAIRLRHEQQFNRKVELNRELRILRNDLEVLLGE